MKSPPDNAMVKIHGGTGQSRAPKAKAIELFQQGVQAHQEGRIAESKVFFEKSLSVSPVFPDALHLLGVVHAQQGRRQHGIGLIQAAIQQNPRVPGYFYNLALIYEAEEDSRAVCEALARATRLDPAYVDAWMKLAFHKSLLGCVSEAIEIYEKVLGLMPGHTAAWSNLGSAYLDSGEQEEACFCFKTAVQLDPDNLFLRGTQAFGSHYDVAATASEISDLHRDFGQRLEGGVTAMSPVTRARDPRDPLVVGLVSGDLRSHPVGYFMESLLPEIDRRRLALQFYSTTTAGDALTRRLQAFGDAWFDISDLDDGGAAALIRQNGADVLVDLAGHTANGRLGVFAMKPAPVQVAWLGYYASTGLTAIDYCIVDQDCHESVSPRLFTERLWPLPETRLCYTPPLAAPEPGPLPASTSGAVTFGSFNTLAKVNGRVKEAWARVLAAVPGSRLLMKAKGLTDAKVRERLHAEFSDLGVSADRLVFSGWSSRDDYFGTYRDIDMVLDTFPFSGGTVSFDSLWMGVPVLTLAGDTLVSRQGASMLKALGMRDWIADDADRYVEIAKAKALDIEALAATRRGLRAHMRNSPLCDAPRFAEHLTSAIEGIWKARYADCQRPEVH